jgi:hypothetical protein
MDCAYEVERDGITLPVTVDSDNLNAPCESHTNKKVEPPGATLVCVAIAGLGVIFSNISLRKNR